MTFLLFISAFSVPPVGISPVCCNICIPFQVTQKLLVTPCIINFYVHHYDPPLYNYKAHVHLCKILSKIPTTGY